MPTEHIETTEPGEVWRRARLKVQQLGELLADDAGRAPEQVQTTLRERAQRLAAPLQTSKPLDDSILCLLFALGEQRYAIAGDHVDSVAPLSTYRRLPGTPRFVLGIVNWRGRFIALLDLLAAFGFESRTPNDGGQLILLRHGSSEFGIYADAILGTDFIRLDELHAPPNANNNSAARHVLGVTETREIVIDANALLYDPALRFASRNQGARPSLPTGAGPV